MFTLRINTDQNSIEYNTKRCTTMTRIMNTRKAQVGRTELRFVNLNQHNTTSIMMNTTTSEFIFTHKISYNAPRINTMTPVSFFQTHPVSNNSVITYRNERRSSTPYLPFRERALHCALVNVHTRRNGSMCDFTKSWSLSGAL